MFDMVRLASSDLRATAHVLRIKLNLLDSTF